MNKKKYPLLILTSFLLFLFPFTSSAVALPASVDGQQLPSLAGVVEAVEGGIVNISTSATQNYGRDSFGNQFEQFFEDEEFFHRFFKFDDRRRERPSMNLGSGVVYDAEAGLILTNAHVLQNASQIRVTLSDGRETYAEAVGSDPEMDLALLKVNLPNLTETNIGNSDDLRVGDFVLAIGNNYGLAATVTSGIVSALGRSGLRLPQSQYQEFIQTDAAINPGSSGGALVNLRGEVIGINTAIFAPGGGNIGIGFAIPINTAVSIADQIVQYGRVRRGILGIQFQELTQALAEAFALQHMTGVLVTRVQPGSAAMQAGLREGDILTHVDGVKISDGSQLRSLIALIRVGEKVDVRYFRDGDWFENYGIIGDREIRRVSGADLSYLLDGAEFANSENTGLNQESGIVISSVEKGSTAWTAGMREGDFVSEVNRARVRNIEDFKRAIVDFEGVLMLKVHREGKARFMVIG